MDDECRKARDYEKNCLRKTRPYGEVTEQHTGKKEDPE
jgi:hypothetical protein